MTNYSIEKPKNKNQGYGIKITKVKVFEDISNNINYVKRIVEVCNACDVDMEFFPDVLENFMSDFENF